MAHLTTRLAALVLAAVVVAPAAAADASGSRSWAGLQVPHLSVPAATPAGFPYPTAVRLGHNRLRAPRWGVSSMAATMDAAIVVSGTSRTDLGPLLELPSHGRPGRVLERRVSGIPVADPAGHVAFWSHRTAHRSRLVAYDTLTRTKQLGPPLADDARVFAVDGDTAYVLDLYGYVASWRTGDPALTPLPAPGGERWFLTDVEGDRLLFTDFEHHGLVVTDLAGATLGTVPHAFYATFSPDGSSLVAWTRDGYRAYDAATFQALPLRGLHGREAYQARWSPDGRLVLTLARSGSQPLDHAVPLGFAACSVLDGRCQHLPGRSDSAIEPFYESSPLGQLITLGD